MVHSCIVCNRVNYLNPNLTFHRFPKDPARRKLWFGLVGILESQPLPKYPELCSDHFHSEDLEVRSNGLTYIKKDANPRRSEGLLFFDDVCNSSDSPLSVSPLQKTLRMSNLCMEALEAAIKSPNRNEGENEGAKSSKGSSSATETASEVMQKIIGTDELKNYAPASDLKNVESKKKRSRIYNFKKIILCCNFRLKC